MNPALVTHLTATITALRESLGEHDGDEVLRADMLEGETDANEILRKLVKARSIAKADAVGASEAMKAITSRYSGREEAAKKRMASHSKMILSVMEAVGERSKKLPEGTISITDGKPSLVLADHFEPPQGYQKIKVEPDKAAIKAALEAGETMPGAELVIGEPIVRVL